MSRAEQHSMGDTRPSNSPLLHLSLVFDIYRSRHRDTEFFICEHRAVSTHRVPPRGQQRGCRRGIRRVPRSTKLPGGCLRQVDFLTLGMATEITGLTHGSGHVFDVDMGRSQRYHRIQPALLELHGHYQQYGRRTPNWRVLARVSWTVGFQLLCRHAPK